MFRRCSVLLALSVPGLWAQAPTAPVINPRGVTNFFSQDPAPGTVGAGALIQITGLNLGPVQGARAATTPWPVQLADVQVQVAGRSAPLYSVSPGTIIAQIPDSIPAGLAEVVVKRQSGSSNTARINVAAIQPAVRTADDSGFGTPWGTASDSSLVLSATGLGPTNPRIAAGGVPTGDAALPPVAPLTAYVGGLRAGVEAAASPKRPGEFDVTVTIPQGARAGDLINVLAANRPANPTVYGSAGAPDVQYVALPAGAPPIAALTGTGMNGNFLMATGPRGTDGCYPAILIDMVQQSATTVPDCLTTANAVLPPVVAPALADTLGALIGPPSGDLQSGISTKVKIFSAAGPPLSAELPSPAAALTAAASGFSAALPGTPPRVVTIDDRTGEVRPASGGAGALPGGGGAAGIPGAAAALAGAFLNVNVDGLKNVYGAALVAQNQFAVVVGDDAAKPTRAKYAIVGNAGDIVFTKDFPAGWLPLLSAPRPVPTGQPNVVAAGPREPISVDPSRRVVYALARASDNSRHGFIAFPFDDAEVRTLPFPDGWFATACLANIPVFPLDLSRKEALLASRVPDNEFKPACPSNGFITLDLGTQVITGLGLPAQAQVLASSASSMNDYVYATVLDTTRTGTSGTIEVLDGVNGSTFTLGIPDGVDGFADTSLRQVPEINTLIAAATKSVAGDQGLIAFNLDNQAASVLPVPDGYTAVSTLDDGGTPCCIATRKIVARALKTGGSAIVIYNLITNDIVLVPNPDKVVSVGAVPGDLSGTAPGGQAPGGGPFPGGGGPGGPFPGGGQIPGGIVPGAGAAGPAAAQLVGANYRANTVSGVAFDSGGKQVGIIVVRVP